MTIDPRPIVLVFGGWADDLEEILKNGFVTHLFPAIEPVIVDISEDVPDWVFWKGAIGKLEEKPELSRDELVEWRQGKEFAELAVKCLLEKTQASANDGFDRSAVRVIIVGEDSELTANLEKALKDSFPNAFICNGDGEESTYLNSFPINELRLKEKVSDALYASRGYPEYVSQLIRKTETEVLAIRGIGKSSLKEIKEALAEHGVELLQESE